MMTTMTITVTITNTRIAMTTPIAIPTISPGDSGAVAERRK